MPPLNIFSRTCIAAAVLNAAATTCSHAATITVIDSGDASSACNLRNALTSFNTGMNVGECVLVGQIDSSNTINFDLPNPSTITLLASTPLSLEGVGYLSITGPGREALEIDASNVSGAFTINDSSVASISGVTITNGGVGVFNSNFFSLIDSEISNNVTSGVGGGLGLFDSTFFSVIDSTISNNSAYSGGGISILESPGGVIEGSVISGNRATGSGTLADGGGINFVTYEANAGTDSLLIESSTITNNSAGPRGSGGGINTYSVTGSNRTSNLKISYSRVSNNTSGRTGGGINIISYDSSNQIITTTISGNSALNDGGGLYQRYGSYLTIDQTTFSNNSADYGGGVNGEHMRIHNSTLSNNSASFGSAILIQDETPENTEISNSTITQNIGQYAIAIDGVSASNIRILYANNVVSNNGSSNCNLASGESIFGVNWLDDTSCGIVSSGDPRLGELADNGGFTKTHAPLPGSGLAGAGLLRICNNLSPFNGVDQRGVPRGSSSCFIGSVEGIVDPTTLFVIPLPNGKSVVVPL